MGKDWARVRLKYDKVNWEEGESGYVQGFIVSDENLLYAVVILEDRSVFAPLDAFDELPFIGDHRIEDWLEL